MKLPKFFRVCKEVRLISDQVGPLENKTPGVDPKLRPFLRISEIKTMYVNQVYFLQKVKNCSIPPNRKHLVQVNLFQRPSFLDQLTHNMTRDS